MLTNKVAFITGAAQGIGRQIAVDMAREGAKVIIGDILPKAGETVELIKQKGGEAAFIPLDITKFDDVQNAVKQIMDSYGKLDILVPNASIVTHNNLLDISPEEWSRVIAINLTGTFYTLKAVLPHMVAQGAGKIIIISSGSAATGSGGGAHYAASKAGQNALVRNLARDFGPDGITANAIAPRVIQTEMLDALYPQGSPARESVINRIPVRRVGLPEDISELCVFLASDKASYINGQIILVDGGRTYAS
ncbi:SDR family NAD(P)-dependent oxidoreductase [Propionispora hippei]|uniref:3-oxoacyl-[acyl-carrier protein] reductase n=1 Tax=Propionispora hippei DSM 15287 TaxID=1123003 RepID=A0A1M6CMQ2_9FIRM|nr:SDR family NAD(P)-dependent oxidoreductase [Propionispora hippei]SHI62270.1 3-oxoacyl-[acyl-carrier protein] reductase [Propionispora hippei DSM 15287]